MGETTLIFFILLHVSLLLNSTFAVNPSGFTLRMVHKDSKESPFYVVDNDHLTQEERFERLLQRSKERAHYIGSKILLHENATSSMNPNVVRFPVVYEGPFYIGLVGIGTFPNINQPFQNYYLMIDSASSLTWVQCNGANTTFYQSWDKWPLYPWENSITYKPLPYSTTCHHRTDKGKCGYAVRYANKAVTSGVLATETFTINPNSGGGLESLKNMVMGCGLYQENFEGFGNNHLKGKPDDIAGILGLGKGAISFPNQFGRFSYCFEKYNKDFEIGNTYLSFGTDATIGGGDQQVHKTPILVTDYNTQSYYLALEDISVAGKSVGFTKKDFMIKADRSGGCMIDSGAPGTVMHINHLNRIGPFVAAYFERIGIRRDTSIKSKLCFFNRPGYNVTVPTITLHFAEAANYSISETGFGVIGSNICLTISGTDAPGLPAIILGAPQQANKRILYDIRNMALSFADEICGKGL